MEATQEGTTEAGLAAAADRLAHAGHDAATALRDTAVVKSKGFIETVKSIDGEKLMVSIMAGLWATLAITLIGGAVTGIRRSNRAMDIHNDKIQGMSPGEYADMMKGSNTLLTRQQV